MPLSEFHRQPQRVTYLVLQCVGESVMSLTAGTPEINGANIKEKLLSNVYPSGAECNNDAQAMILMRTPHNRVNIIII